MPRGNAALCKDIVNISIRVDYDPLEHQFIEFQPCGSRSYQRDDIRNQYCSTCHRFIGDLMQDEARK